MKFQIENLGPIKHCDLTLNDLTILVGGNNTGKTFVTYAVYGVLKNWFSFMKLEAFENLSERLFESQKLKFSPMELKALIFEVMNPSWHAFKDITNVTYNDWEGLLKGSAIRVDFQFKMDLANDEEELSIAGNIVKGELRNNGLELSFAKDLALPWNYDDFKASLHAVLTKLVFQKFFLNPFVITSERLGISLFHTHIKFHQKDIDDYFKMKKENPTPSGSFDLFGFMKLISKSYSTFGQPIQDEIDFVYDQETEAEKHGEIDLGHATSMLNELLGADLRKEGSTRIRFSSNEDKQGYDIPIHLASSCSRCLVDLYLYMNYKAKKGDLLIIDEPESHLTLKNQRLMARLLAAIVNSGIKVFITTHSDFLVKELNNLIILSNDFNGKTEWLEAHASQYSIDDALNHNRVSVYQAKEGTLQKMTVTNRGIEVPFFDEALKDLFNTSMDLDFMMDESE